MILSKSDGRCWYCGGDLYLNQITTRDHFLPKSAGGSDDLGNLVPCCSQCNHAKGDRMLEEYRLRLQLSKEAEGHEFWFETTDSLGRCLARPVAV
jgi:5-methylcytosine-specific restriction endonuclease McrA